MSPASKTPRTPAVSPKAPAQRRAPHEDADAPREQAAAQEIAGRHKNAGQKDHKAARTARRTVDRARGPATPKPST